MSVDSTRISRKRDIDSAEKSTMPEQPPSKRSKDGNLMDYWKPKPSGSRPQKSSQNLESESRSKHFPKAVQPYNRAEQKARGSKSNNDRQSPDQSAKDTKYDQQSPDENTNDEDLIATQSTDARPQEQTIEDQNFNTLTLPESIGDIFSAPPNTLLIHACNCQGSWGAGIAAAFRKSYPSAYKKYASHCDDHGSDLFGTALLIPPQKLDFGGKHKRNPHFIGCLFTSRSMGRKKDSPSQILDATRPAMIDLLVQVREWNARAEDGRRVGEVRMCKINSGLFAVPWEETVAVLQSISTEGEDFKRIEVVSREE